MVICSVGIPCSMKGGKFVATSLSILLLSSESSSSASQFKIILPASGMGVNSNPNLVGYLPVIIEALDGAQVALAA